MCAFSLTYTTKNFLLLFAMVYLMIILLNKTDELYERDRKIKTIVYSAPQNNQEPVFLKTILMWNPFFNDNGYEFGLGGEVFRDHDCPVSDCFITDQKTWQAVEDFDAIVFHGAEYHPEQNLDFPERRSHAQRYVYFNMESPSNRPVQDNLNQFFNWTMTYRLGSDIIVPYYQITDNKGEIVAPMYNPKWIEQSISYANMTDRIKVVKGKTKPVAWFASNCKSKNRRESFVRELQDHIQVDVFGSCGKLTCSREDEKACFEMLKKDYFFYLAFENSNCIDYITEKVTNALLNDVVPIIYGGANLTNFLPKGSYIDANQMTTIQLAAAINYFQKNPLEYLKFFDWKDFYRVHVHQNYAESPFCKLCEMLHAKNQQEKVYNIREWWHGIRDVHVCSNPV